MSQPTKKVLFTSHTANFSKFNRPFMRWFKKLGYEVHYASDGAEEVLDTDKSFKISFERSPFKLNNILAIYQLKKIIDSEHYDIIHTHTPMGSVVTRIAARNARKYGTRVIYTAHGFHFFKGAPFLNWIIYYPIEKVMAHFTDTLVTINEEDHKRAKLKFSTNVEYIPGVGVDPKKFTCSLSAQGKFKLRNTLGIKEGDFVLIYVAELSKRKRQLWLIKTLAHYLATDANTHLLLVGEDSLNGKIQKQVAKEGITKNVHLLGYRQDIPSLMQISDLAVSSSSQEGLPVNIMEALFSNLPIIATECRGTNELIKDLENCYLIQKDSQVSFVEAIKKVRNSPKSSQIRRTDTYRIDAVIKSMAEIYSVGKKV